ncbi:MAG TPA: HesA/MoeB/ThiF family protein [Syntrophorhabdaceae bacterium]|nr:HesA/MoeB/ThiF family protein [Syntrophorhabdaceae bacterium]HQE79302.1 HesA/MoeB/ThiF family protein [Syntrophorhabdaceae bacterium]HQH42658.1 HesA/MoeB/ThiF family protein [Syntrophorhabdaceae bacterium]
MNVILTKEELERYKRQIIIPSIGKDGQEKLKKSKVFVAGFGGLGSISAQYLVAAGVGSIKVIDKDVVDISNLNRQIIHWTCDLGKKKAESGLYKLKNLNPHCNIEAISVELDETNVYGIIGDSHIIVDATDNLETRRVLNRVSLEKSIPFIYGGVDGFSGMVTTFVPHETPCFDCLFPFDIKKKGAIGVVGPTPGIIASIQVMEAIKLILGIEGTLKGRLLYFSGIDMLFREVKVEKNPECPVCSRYRAGL